MDKQPQKPDAENFNSDGPKAEREKDQPDDTLARDDLPEDERIEQQNDVA
jgi:hypothetical protein